MNAEAIDHAIQVCEEILRKDKNYNLDQKIYPSNNVIIDRLIDRRVELFDTYNELYQKLAGRSHALSVFFDCLISASSFWNPEKLIEVREGAVKLREVNALISKYASELARLLRKRSSLNNKSGFHDNTHYDVCMVLEQAAAKNYLFESWLRAELNSLSERFSLKYWPSIDDFIEEIARDADHAEISASDPVTAAAVIGQRGSKADFFKALFALLKQNQTNDALLPADFKLSDSALASLANCALNLDFAEIVDAAYVKRFRQRLRASGQRT